MHVFLEVFEKVRAELLEAQANLYAMIGG